MTDLRSSIGLAVALALLGAGACTEYRVHQLGPGERVAEGFTFSQVRARDQLVAKGSSSAGGRIRVFHAAGEENLAAAALREARRSMEYVSESFGEHLDLSVDLFLFPWAEGDPIPSYRARGADYVGIVFYGDPDDLLGSAMARRRLRAAVVHKAAIVHLLETTPLEPKDDRWILEGLPEALVYRYTESDDREVWLAENAWHPPLPLLATTRLRPWDQEELVALMDAAQDGEQRSSYYLGYNETRQLAAAKGLLTRWLQALEGEGSTSPARELLVSLRHRRGPIDWEATRALASEQTAQSLEDLASPTASEVEEWKHSAWRKRLSPDLLERVWALRTLGLLGLPTGFREEWPSLLSAFELSGLDLGERYSLWEAAAGAIVRADDPGLAKQALAKLEADDSKYRHAYTALPTLWEVLARVDRERSLEALLTLLGDDDHTLVVQEAADRALRRLTGTNTGWDARRSESERERATQRWRSELEP